MSKRVPTFAEVEVLRHQYLDTPTDRNMRTFLDAVMAHTKGRPIALPTLSGLMTEALG